ncbi:hypothetical protein bsdE14_17670 [Clostridium omnivorum]|uniref:Uncharacterized protein n=1 Tax=Clostridium omnivorum TaxID=1604902 RepID=A0ABQ5N554_9CLOT|nr:hypothetical protein bsdE14_17670 [Clostridium sp. E14]
MYLEHLNNKKYIMFDILGNKYINYYENNSDIDIIMNLFKKVNINVRVFVDVSKEV